MDETGSGYLTWLVAGMDYVAQHASEIEVANMSLGWTGNSSAARTAIQNAVNKGVVFVVAAGNDGQDIYGPDGTFGTSDDFEPAAYPEVATVSALADSDGLAGGTGAATPYGPDDTLATFSNFSSKATPGNPVTSPGAGIDVAAPGVNILSTLPGGTYGTASGTSMAAPHVTGAVALYIASTARASNETGVAAIRQHLIDAAQQQSLWGPSNTADRDTNHEGSVYVASGSGPANLAPAITIVSPANGATFSTGSSITFSGTAIDEDGDLTASLSWSSSKDGFIGAGGSFSKALTDGTHTITASAIDSKGKTGSSSVVITVGCVPTSLRVSGVTYALSKNKRDLSAIVSLQNNCNKPVIGATVSVYITNWTLARVWGGTGTTNQSGTETFVVRSAPAGQYSTQVTDIVAAGLSWDGNTPSNSYTKK
jgi:subtilisin family serine protease